MSVSITSLAQQSVEREFLKETTTKLNECLVESSLIENSQKPFNHNQGLICTETACENIENEKTEESFESFESGVSCGSEIEHSLHAYCEYSSSNKKNLIMIIN